MNYVGGPGSGPVGSDPKSLERAEFQTEIHAPASTSTDRVVEDATGLNATYTLCPRLLYNCFIRPAQPSSHNYRDHVVRIPDTATVSDTSDIPNMILIISSLGMRVCIYIYIYIAPISGRKGLSASTSSNRDLISRGPQRKAAVVVMALRLHGSGSFHGPRHWQIEPC